MPNLWLILSFLASLVSQPTAPAPPPMHVAPNAGETLPSEPGVEEARRLEAARVRIRRLAALMYSDLCDGPFEIPDRAFMPVEITGYGTPELAVSLALARCGDSASTFTGTGGVHMLFWRIEDGRTSLILDQQMHGFTPASPYLVTFQHGGFCPGGAGPQQCRVVYRWDPLGNRLETEDRHLMGDEGPVYGYGRLTGTESCDPAQMARGRCRR